MVGIKLWMRILSGSSSSPPNGNPIAIRCTHEQTCNRADDTLPPFRARSFFLAGEAGAAASVGRVSAGFKGCCFRGFFLAAGACSVSLHWCESWSLRLRFFLGCCSTSRFPACSSSCSGPGVDAKGAFDCCSCCCCLRGFVAGGCSAPGALS